jgi:hypothetical protein
VEQREEEATRISRLNEKKKTIYLLILKRHSFLLSVHYKNVDNFTPALNILDQIIN